MKKLDVDQVIHCLGEIAATLRQNPQRALKDLRRIGSLIDTTIPYRDGHSIRVADHCLAMADYLGFDEQEKVNLEVAALLHDFGKIGIDEEILRLPRKLTTEERQEVEMHVMRGYYMLTGFNELIEALSGIRCHHEFYDGRGYPAGLARNSIPLMGRIIAVADAFDAMTSDRPYRHAMTRAEALEQLKIEAGHQFDPALVRIFMKHLTDVK
jgi:HD-GYP domain-containing protein (c-di-GMP phosphodiesterase class II)